MATEQGSGKVQSKMAQLKIAVGDHRSGLIEHWLQLIGAKRVGLALHDAGQENQRGLLEFPRVLPDQTACAGS